MARRTGLVAIGPGAALAAWVVVLAALNVTAEPVACAVAFAALAWLAMRCGYGRLVVVALVAGAGLVLVVPGVSLVDGSFAFTFGQAGLPHGGGQWAASVAAALRVPAQLLAATFLLLVPARLLLAGAARVSPDAALLGALTARMQPLLGRDVRDVRDALASRGLRLGAGAPVVERAQAMRSLWEGVVSGILDRAFVTASALDARGWGVARPTNEALQHPQLRDAVRHDAVVDRVLVGLAVVITVTAVVLRERGLAMPPGGGLVVVPDPATAQGGVLLAVLLGALALVPLAARDRSPCCDQEVAAGDSLVPGRSGRGEVLELVDVSMQHAGAVDPSLVGATMRVEPGELVVLAGPSGGGKSTLLDVVSGVAPRTTGGRRSGVVRLGAHVLGASRIEHGRPRVAAVFQLPESQVLVGRVAEEVAFGPRHAGLPRAEVERRVLEALDQLDARHLAGRDCATLSGGELQRVLLAAALALDPAVLVLDEPTSQLDRAGEERFWSVLDAVRRERGIAVVVAEHRLDALLLRADAVVHVAAGSVGPRLSSADAVRDLAGIADDPYAGLAPAPVAGPGAIARLSLRCGRLLAGDRVLLRNLAVALPPGAVVTLEGRNGTGKSTLLRAIRGLHPGVDAHVDGIALGEVGSSARRVAWQGQGAGALLPGRTALDAAAQTSRRLGLGDAHVRVWLDAAGLGDRLDAHPSELSVGQRQRLAIVASTAHRPPVWLLDEPTRGMDGASRRWVAMHVLAHAAAGGVVVIATHDAALAAAVATHRLRLDEHVGPSLVAVARTAAGTPEPVRDGGDDGTRPLADDPEVRP